MTSNSPASLIFIPGKNWRLSLAELISFCESRHINVEVSECSRAFFVLSVSDPNMIDISLLGGTIKIGKIVGRLETEVVKEALLSRNKQKRMQIENEFSETGMAERMFKRDPEGKMVFGVSVYWSDSTLQPISKTLHRFLGSTAKRLLAAQGKKANFMGFRRERNSPQLTHVEVLKKKMVENSAEILFCGGREHSFVAYTTAVHNPFEFQKRDVGKPCQRRIFGMPPRLARIMINLAITAERQVLLDPFCGVGTILMEALLSGTKVIGMDINRWCVEAASRNLEWLKGEYSLENVDFRIVQGDVSKMAEKIGKRQVDCIVSEPDLGPALRQVPTVPYALKIIEKLHPLYEDFLREASEVVKKGGRIVVVSPLIKTRSGQHISMRIGEEAAKFGFKTVLLFRREVFEENVCEIERLMNVTRFRDADQRHKVGREISVLQK
jgi:tRNA G10  N-methylase Trm11